MGTERVKKTGDVASLRRQLFYQHAHGVHSNQHTVTSHTSLARNDTTFGSVGSKWNPLAENVPAMFVLSPTYSAATSVSSRILATPDAVRRL